MFVKEQRRSPPLCVFVQADMAHGETFSKEADDFSLFRFARHLDQTFLASNPKITKSALANAKFFRSLASSRYSASGLVPISEASVLHLPFPEVLWFCPSTSQGVQNCSASQNLRPQPPIPHLFGQNDRPSFANATSISNLSSIIVWKTDRTTVLVTAKHRNEIGLQKAMLPQAPLRAFHAAGS